MEEKIIKIASWIEKNSQAIIDNIEFESIDVYNFIQNEFNKGDVTTNYLFQFVYRSFYRLDNAGLTPEFKTEYFKIMEENRHKTEFDYRKELHRLYDIPTWKGLNSLQFSFITKMAHTIDVNRAIYDSEVSRVFGITRPYNGMEVNKRIERYLTQLNIIEDGYQTIIDTNILETTLNYFDKRFENNSLTDVMKLDFIFWSGGKRLKKSK